MLICGIDPGLNVTGYGLLAATPRGVTLKGTGYIRTSAKEPLPKRLEDIHGALRRVLEQYKPQALVLEKIYAHYRHPVTASLLGHVRGVIAMLARECAIDYFEYSATRVKKTVTGKGHASKLQVQRMIEHMLGFSAEALGPVDVTDAVGVALTHVLCARQQQSLA
ncbi:MAG: crossover junction endodeoxyribonuclease RuvC [Deltaproteobacteria bacterium]